MRDDHKDQRRNFKQSYASYIQSAGSSQASTVSIWVQGPCSPPSHPQPPLWGTKEVLIYILLDNDKINHKYLIPELFCIKIKIKKKI